MRSGRLYGNSGGLFSKRKVVCSKPRSRREDLQPRSSRVLPWCSWLVHTKWAVATSAVIKQEGQSLGKVGGASSMIFQVPKSKITMLIQLLFSPTFQRYLRFLCLIFPDAWSFFSLPINFQKSTMTLVFSPEKHEPMGFLRLPPRPGFLTFAIF